jgi:predicted naringenin-chalcone synthase
MVIAGAAITGAGAAFPTALSQNDLWDGYFARSFGQGRAAKAAFEASGIATRHAALNPLIEDASSWSTGTRMERYLLEAMPLGKEAMTTALDATSLSPEQIGLLAVVSCTGYATPGIDIRLARDLGMSSTLQRLNIGHMGCHAALPALATVADYVRAHGKPALLLSIELSSLHVQPPTSELSQAVIHSLFSDAAAAIVVEPHGFSPRPGARVLDVITHTDVASFDDMTWNISDRGFRMTLSRHISAKIARETEPLVDTLLLGNGMSRGDVDGWAIHPGGPMILDTLGGRLHLDRQALSSSRQVLFDHGNCSSATVLLVLDAVRKRLGDAPGRHIIMLAFGPGLTLCAALLRTI